jgi:hypothetical protein
MPLAPCLAVAVIRRALRLVASGLDTHYFARILSGLGEESVPSTRSAVEPSSLAVGASTALWIRDTRICLDARLGRPCGGLFSFSGCGHTHRGFGGRQQNCSRAQTGLAKALGLTDFFGPSSGCGSDGFDPLPCMQPRGKSTQGPIAECAKGPHPPPDSTR